MPRNREFRPDPRIQCIRRLPYILPVLRSGGFGDSAEAAGDDVVRPYDVIFDLIGGGMGGFRGSLGILRDYEIISDNGIPTGYSTAGKPGTTPRYGESAAATAALRR